LDSASKSLKDIQEMSAMKRLIQFALFLGLMFNCVAVKAQEVTIVANSSVKATSVSADELRDVFTGDKTSLKDGSHVTPVTLKAGPVHEAFLKKYVGKDDSAFRAGWRSLVFTGQGSMPKTFDTEAALVDYVAANPGAIGYISPGAATKEGVKTLPVK
jgi:ABC-type phosphate transport system substrate-binding protein